MEYNNPKIINSLFWALHISGWFLFFAANFIIVTGALFPEPLESLHFILKYFFGFLVCLVLRNIYRRSNYHKRSLSSFLLVIFSSIIVGAHLWLGAIYAIDMFLIHVVKTTNQHIISHYSNLYSFYLNTGLMFCIYLMGWTAPYFGIKLWMEWKEQKERADKANIYAQSVQLRMLRYQLNPHFLFNSLNSIRGLIEEDENTAKNLVTELAEFLRYSLISKNYSNVPLNKELEAMRHYFVIQSKRYEDKLDVRFKIDPSAEEFPVLSFLLHPLVENAVKYGMQTSSLPLKILIQAEVIGGLLKLQVSNTGKWVDSDIEKEQNSSGTGTGLENVRKRLENAFPGKHSFDIIKEKGNVHVKIEIKAHI